MRDEGVIKFQCRWAKTPQPVSALIAEIAKYRNLLYKDGLIGVYTDGIGFGNISIRCLKLSSAGLPTFIISASQTGHVEQAGLEHFVKITDYDIEGNWAECQGLAKASSESLTHAMVYETFPEAQAVIHVHNGIAWKKLQNALPTSGADVPYGTLAMAREVNRLARESSLPADKIFIMAGHKDGILTFGTSLSDAYGVVTRYVKPLQEAENYNTAHAEGML